MNTILFFLRLSYKYKFRLFFLLTYSIISGYYISFWPILIRQIENFDSKIYLLLIAAMHFSFNYIKELMLFPIHNYATYILKSNIINNSYSLSFDEIQPGKIISSLQRSGFTRYFFKNIINCFKYGSTILNTIYLIYAKNNETAIFNLFALLIYFFCFVYYKNYYKKLRYQAWHSTELAGIAQANGLNQAIGVKQNLIDDPNESALQNEYKSWHEYYLKSNSWFIIFHLFLLFILIIPIYKNFGQTILFLSWNLASSISLLSVDIKSLISINIDLEIFLKKNKIKKNNNKFILNHENLIIENLYINKENKNKNITLGPFNFSTDKKIIALNGPNGAGKTQIGLSIAQIIEYKGIIHSRKAIYISLHDKLIDNLNHDNHQNYSQGENAMLIIENAFAKAKQNGYGMIIIDELLDILSYENLKKIIKQINKQTNNMDQMFLIITHSNEIKKMADIVWEIK